MITSCDEAIDRLRAIPGLSICPRPLLVLPLLRTGCLSTVLSVESPDAGWADEFDAEFHALEAATGLRDHTATGAGVDQVLRELARTGGRPRLRRELALLSYQALQPHWRTPLAELGARLVEPAPSAPLSALRDKTAQRAWLRSLGVRTPPDAVVDALDHRQLRRRFGDTYVVQTPRGSGGKGTHLVTEEADLLRIGAAAGPWLVSEYVDGAPVNVHALVSADGTVRVMRPSVQLTRVEGVGAAFGAYSGCDFAAPALLPARALARAAEQTRRVGAALAGLGYRGLFGTDFVLDGTDDALLLEVNSRMQGSTWLLGELELAQHALPSALRHVLERHGRTTGGEPSQDPSDGCQLVVRHTGGPVRVAAAPTGGLHRLKDGALRRCGDGFGLLECGPDDCVLLQLPSPGLVLQPGVAIARIVARYSLTAPDGTGLTPHGQRLVEALHAGFALELLTASVPC
ncbi:ATP-grasp domain-containing protein [Kitasatospora griseola]|uniref:ATP-grasp domain-containing protein n=1 Tax=Kitasatospora griseola TaxID=2064 RepID=UPI00166FE4FE|nr:ATP-grasp domain-containing protein [Kitasatospora griseola]